MVLRKWNKVIRGNMGAYFPDTEIDDPLEFPNELSPLTNFSLDVFSNIMSRKNMIINFPDFKFSPASLFAYIFADKFDQNVFILADEQGESLNSKSKFSLNKNHYLLQGKYDAMVFRLFPVFYLKKLRDNEEDLQKNSVEYKLSLEKYLPRAKHKFKISYTEESVLSNEYVPKFIIDTDRSLFSIKEKLTTILKTNDKYLNPKEHPIGLIIIENADRFFHSLGRLENFISWFKELGSEAKLLIHFNNPSIEYIKILVDELDFAVLPFNKYILENNNYLKSISKDYFNNLDPFNYQLLNRYNMDSKSLFGKKPKISINDHLIFSGSLDSHFGSAYSTFKKIDVDNVYNQYSIHKARELLFTLYNLTINPTYLKISFKINKEWIRGSIPHFIKNFKSRLYMEKRKNRFYIHSFLDSLSNMYCELANCKRINEDLSFSRKAKDYELYELLKNFDKKGKKVFVGTYSDVEPNILKEILKKGGISDNIVPISMKMLIQKSNSQKRGAILVLPGVIPEVFTSELYRPYKKIIILSYDGNNHKFLRQQFDSLFGNILEEKQYMDYLKDILEQFGDAEDNCILNDFNKRFELVQFEQEEKEVAETEIVDQEIDEPDDNVFSMDLNLNEYMGEWGKSKSNLNVDLSNMINQNNYETISFKLKNIQSDQFVEKKLPINKSYLTFDNIHHIDDAKELKPSELKSGDYIIIIDNDEKKSLLNLVTELSNFNFKINTDLVEYWKLEFLNYVESNNLKYSEVYKIYCNNGGDKTYQTVMQWCKGELLGPLSPNDLYIIGKIMNDNFIMDNYLSMFQQIVLMRTSHRLIGRKLKKMIKSILTDEYLDVSTLDENELLIYENIQNGIYQIV